MLHFCNVGVKAVLFSFVADKRRNFVRFSQTVWYKANTEYKLFSEVRQLKSVWKSHRGVIQSVTWIQSVDTCIIRWVRVCFWYLYRKIKQRKDVRSHSWTRQKRCSWPPQNCRKKVHAVYFDNFFTSYDLLACLRDAGYYACGTMKEIVLEIVL